MDTRVFEEEAVGQGLLSMSAGWKITVRDLLVEISPTMFAAHGVRY